MVVKRIIKLCPELEVDSLADPRILGQRKVHVLVVRASKAKNARARASVSKHPCAARARAGRFERCQGFECRWVEKPSAGRYVRGAPLPGIEVIGVLEKRIHTLLKAHQAALSRVTREASARADPEWRTSRVANDRADLPASHHMIHGIIVVQIVLAFAERQLVNESCRQDLRNVIGCKGTIPSFLKWRDHPLQAVPC